MPARHDALVALRDLVAADLDLAAEGNFAALEQQAGRWERLRATIAAAREPLDEAEVVLLREVQQLNAKIRTLLEVARADVSRRAQGLGRVRTSLSGYRRASTHQPRCASGLEV